MKIEPKELKPTFQSPFKQYKEMNGKEFTIIRKLNKGEEDIEVDGLYLIKFKNGLEIQAWADEIFYDG